MGLGCIRCRRRAAAGSGSWVCHVLWDDAWEHRDDDRPTGVLFYVSRPFRWIFLGLVRAFSAALAGVLMLVVFGSILGVIVLVGSCGYYAITGGG